MFRITCYVEDKQLATLLHTLAGISRGQPEIVPVVNVVEKGGGAPQAKTNGNVVQLFAQYLDTHPGDVTPKYVQEFQQSIGRSPGGYNNVLHKAKMAKLIKQSGTGSASTYKRNSK